jgi:ATP-dependent Clp protease ATP-binding subunit ClpA
MFSKIRQRFRDMKTVAALCAAAERYANTSGQREPGAEHFVLAALELPDGTARRAFARTGVDPAGFRDAIEQQHREALQNVGIEPGVGFNSASPVQATTGTYQATASAQALMQMMAETQRGWSEPLLGAHVLAAAAKPTYGTVSRALRSMGLEPAAIRDAAETEIGVLRIS